MIGDSVNPVSETKDQFIDPALKSRIIRELTLTKQMSMLDVHSRKDALQIRYVLADLYNHGYLYSQIKRTPDNLIATTDKQLYRIFYVTKKFNDAVEKGEKIE